LPTEDWGLCTCPDVPGNDSDSILETQADYGCVFWEERSDDAGIEEDFYRYAEFAEEGN